MSLCELHMAGGDTPPARVAVRLLLALVLGAGMAWPGDANAFGAFGEVALKKRGTMRGRLHTDTLDGRRGVLDVSSFAPSHVDHAGDVSVAWMLPTDTKCPLVQPVDQREAAVVMAAEAIRELLPQLRKPIAVKAYVVPMLVRFQHKAKFDMTSDQLTLEIGMSVPCGSKTATADLLSVLIHEVAHIRAWSRRTPNRFSNEAIAHSVHAAAWWKIHGAPPDFRTFPYNDNAVPKDQRWSRLFRGERPLSTRAGRVAQYALASLPAAPSAAIAAPDTVAAYVRCLLEERPDFKKGNPATVFAETRGAHCSPGKRWEPLAGP